MSLPIRLAAFYCAHFIQAGLFMAYFPLYLASRGFGAVEIALGARAAVDHAHVRARRLGRRGGPDRRAARDRGLVVRCTGKRVPGAAVRQSFAAVAMVIGVSSLLSAGALPIVEAITLGALAGQPGRYGPIRMWGSVGFVARGPRGRRMARRRARDGAALGRSWASRLLRSRSPYRCRVALRARIPEPKRGAWTARRCGCSRAGFAWRRRTARCTPS
jgi:hypothetical protein